MQYPFIFLFARLEDLSKEITEDMTTAAVLRRIAGKLVGSRLALNSLFKVSVAL